MFCFGSNGEGNGQFNAPTGLAVDAQDNILVADWGNSRIQIFDSQGSFLSFVNTVVCPLYGPQGLALTHDGHIVVADSGNHCFKLYKYLQWRPPLDPQVLPAQYVYLMFRWQFCVPICKVEVSREGQKKFEITTLDISCVVTVKCIVEILQNFVVFSEYRNLQVHALRPTYNQRLNNLNINR